MVQIVCSYIITSYLKACEVWPDVQNLINSVNNVSEITDVVRDKFEWLYETYLGILRNEKPDDTKNLKDVARHYLPTGIFNKYFIPR